MRKTLNFFIVLLSSVSLVNSQTVSTFGSGLTMNWPAGSTFDSLGNVYVAEFGGGKVTKITTAGVMSNLPGTYGNPMGLVFDSVGNLYVSGWLDCNVHRITPGGAVEIYAGTSTWATVNGPRLSASFKGAASLAIDSADNIYVLEFSVGAIRLISNTGIVSTYYQSPFTSLGSFCRDHEGNFYFPEYGSHRIYKLSPSKELSLYAGSSPGNAGGDRLTTARFNGPKGVAIDFEGNIYVADTDNNLIKIISTSGIVFTLAGGTGVFNTPDRVGVDPFGTVFVSDSGNHVMKRIERSAPPTLLSAVFSNDGNSITLTFNPDVTFAQGKK